MLSSGSRWAERGKAHKVVTSNIILSSLLLTFHLNRYSFSSLFCRLLPQGSSIEHERPYSRDKPPVDDVVHKDKAAVKDDSVEISSTLDNSSNERL